MIVMKFGGTSVNGADNMREVVQTVLESRGEDTETVVVVSAMAGVTDALLKAARAAGAGQANAWEHGLDDLEQRHLDVAHALAAGAEECGLVCEHIDRVFAELRAILQSIAVLGELTPRALDRVASTGERLAAPLVSMAFRAAGIASEPVESSSGVVITDAHFGEATPDDTGTWYGTRTKIRPMLGKGQVPVCTGYIGSTPDGVITTLGRGGSDYSAAILGAALEADEVWIWSDVDGILTADPKIVPDAKVIGHLSYAAAAEMAACGADVLHPKTIRPLIKRAVPLRLKNTFNPAHPGTLISNRYSEHPPAIISTGKLCLVTIRSGEGNGWTPEVTAQTLRHMSHAGIDVLLFLQSAWQNGVSLLVRENDREAAMLTAAADKLAVHLRPGAATVSVIGPEVIRPTLAALGDSAVNVLTISQATTDAGVIVVVPEAEMPPLVRHLHERVSAGQIA
ncbi:MAG: aspartate kinase [Anaerolineae bacterium]|nr:aspartate kinase [Anaerolineae bacterium]